MASILVICTGNICRSPMAEGFLRAGLARRLGPDAPLVASAGLIAREGTHPEPGAVRAAAERDVDIEGHIARRLRADLTHTADLIVTMTGEHRDVVVDAAPDAAARTFTLKELVRLLEALPASAAGSGDVDHRLHLRVSEADALRRSSFRSKVHDEDVGDPLGMPLETFRALGWELETWCERLVAALFGREQVPVDARSAG